jgi:hypothetical protein
MRDLSIIERIDRWISGKRLLFLFIAAMAVYLIMVLITLPELSQRSGGLAMFDLMPGGYDSDHANSVLQALGEDGRLYYLTRQIPLDLLYPGLLSAVLAGTWLFLLRRGHIQGKYQRGWIIIAVGAGLADYGENVFIMIMLISFPEISDGLVTTASILTILKSGLTTIFFVTLIILSGIIFWRRKYLSANSK